MPINEIVIKGAKEHNLKNIDISIPRDKLVVITGLSGSGKSSLAFDTIYAEGQRRYVESLSAYARQFLEQMDKPDVEFIEGLSPAISIEQKSVSKNPRSTVGTVTEIYDYLRLLFARIGHPHCPSCGNEIQHQSASQIIDQLMMLKENTKFIVISPLIRSRKGEYKKLLENIQQQGFVRARINGVIVDINESLNSVKLEKYKKHNIDVVVDRLVAREDIRQRLADSIETALKLGQGLVYINFPDEKKEIVYSENFACPDCGISFEEMAPRNFSFNSPHGACPDCHGLGTSTKLDPDLIVPDQDKSISEGAIVPWYRIAGYYSSGATGLGGYYYRILEQICTQFDIDMNRPWRLLTPKQHQIILYGKEGEKDIAVRGKQYWKDNFEGVIPHLQRRFAETNADYVRNEIYSYMRELPCPECKGSRLKPETLAVTVSGKNIHQVTEMSVKQAFHFFNSLELSEKEEIIAQRILKEIRNRLGFLVNVGLEYLSVNRAAATLSGGESQRIRLATQIGSQLVGVLYILDEPSIGLHQRDNHRLLDTLCTLRDIGNSVLVVEHDEDTMREADWLIDMGPGAGKHGGYLVSQGTPSAVMADPNSITGKYLSGKLKIDVPEKRRTGNRKFLEIIGARENNLKNVTAKIPLGKFVAITGVSGSGKSTLINEILFKQLSKYFYNARAQAGHHDKILGLEHIDKVIDISQEPIGRTPRSNPATYTGVFTDIRDLFTSVPEARARGYKPGRFSFNVKGGRCENCQGDGTIKIEMHFLPDVYVNCEVCKGQRFNKETLEIKYKGKSIYEVLRMTVEEAQDFFQNIPTIKRYMDTLVDVGLGYIELGQSATTLSGGEAQRVKLATELSRRSTGRTLYLLDEPTTGLHFDDVKRLLEVLNRLVDSGNTVLVIEHNLDVIKTADYIIDMGPEGGDEGGTIVAEGTPEKVAQNKHSYTGHFLKKVLSIE